MDFSLFMSGLSARCSAGIVRLARRFFYLAGTFMSKLCLAVLRAIIAGVVFSLCAMATMRYLGVPIQVPPEVFDTLESVGRLARILS